MSSQGRRRSAVPLAEVGALTTTTTGEGLFGFRWVGRFGRYWGHRQESAPLVWSFCESSRVFLGQIWCCLVSDVFASDDSRKLWGYSLVLKYEKVTWKGHLVLHTHRWVYSFSQKNFCPGQRCWSLWPPKCFWHGPGVPWRFVPLWPTRWTWWFCGARSSTGTRRSIGPVPICWSLLRMPLIPWSSKKAIEFYPETCSRFWESDLVFLFVKLERSKCRFLDFHWFIDAGFSAVFVSFCPGLPSVDFDALGPEASMIEAVAALSHSVGRSASRMSQVSSGGLPQAAILMLGQSGSSEGKMTCLVLKSMLMERLRKPMMLLTAVHEAQAARKAKYILVVLTGGLFQDQGFLKMLEAVDKINPNLEILGVNYRKKTWCHQHFASFFSFLFSFFWFVFHVFLLVEASLDVFSQDRQRPLWRGLRVPRRRALRAPRKRRGPGAGGAAGGQHLGSALYATDVHESHGCTGGVNGEGCLRYLDFWVWLKDLVKKRAVKIECGFCFEDMWFDFPQKNCSFFLTLSARWTNSHDASNSPRPLPWASRSAKPAKHRLKLLLNPFRLRKRWNPQLQAGQFRHVPPHQRVIARTVHRHLSQARHRLPVASRCPSPGNSH